MPPKYRLSPLNVPFKDLSSDFRRFWKQAGCLGRESCPPRIWNTFQKDIFERLVEVFSPHCSNGVLHVTGAWPSALRFFILHLEPQAKVKATVMHHDESRRACERPIRSRQVPLSVRLTKPGLLWSLTRHDRSGLGKGGGKQGAFQCPTLDMIFLSCMVHLNTRHRCLFCAASVKWKDGLKASYSDRWCQSVNQLCRNLLCFLTICISATNASVIPDRCGLALDRFVVPGVLPVLSNMASWAAVS